MKPFLLNHIGILLTEKVKSLFGSHRNLLYIASHRNKFAVFFSENCQLFRYFTNRDFRFKLIMSKSGIIFFVINIITYNLHLNCAIDSSESEVMSFHKIDEKLETLTKQLYKLLNADTALWEKNKTKLLLAIRNHSQQIAKNNLKIYRDVETANKLDFDNKPSNSFFNLTEAIQKVQKFITKQQFNNSIEYIEKNIFKILDPTNFYRVVNQFTLDVVKPLNYTDLNETMARILDLTLWRKYIN